MKYKLNKFPKIGPLSEWGIDDGIVYPHKNKTYIDMIIGLNRSGKSLIIGVESNFLEELKENYTVEDLDIDALLKGIIIVEKDNEVKMCNAESFQCNLKCEYYDKCLHWPVKKLCE